MTPISTFFGLLTLLFPFVAANHWGRRHQEVAHRARGDLDLHKRQSFSNARFTFYDVGLGACGQTNVPSDWIVAINAPQYGDGYPGPQCYKSITIQYGGKTAVATIMDECMGCPYSGLDFSEGLFAYFADLSEGVLYGTWWYNDGGSGSGGGDQSTTTPWTPPTTTWNQPTTSTLDYTLPTTSSTPDYTPTSTSSTPAYTPPPTTSKMSTTSSTSPTSSINTSTSMLSGLVSQTGGVVPAPDTSDPQNLLVINKILIEISVALSEAKKNE